MKKFSIVLCLVFMAFGFSRIATSAVIAYSGMERLDYYYSFRDNDRVLFTIQNGPHQAHEVRILSLKKPEMIRNFVLSQESDTPMHFYSRVTENEKYFVYDSYKGVRSLNLETGADIPLYSHTGSGGFSLQVSTYDDRAIVLSDDNGEIIIYDVEHGSILNRFKEEPKYVAQSWGFCFSRDLTRYITSQWIKEQSYENWYVDLITGEKKKIGSLRRYDCDAYDAEFAQNEERFLAFDDYSVSVIDRKTKQNILRVGTYQKNTNSDDFASLSKDGKLLIVNDRDYHDKSLLDVYRIDTGEKTRVRSNGRKFSRPSLSLDGTRAFYFSGESHLESASIKFMEKSAFTKIDTKICTEESVAALSSDADSFVTVTPGEWVELGGGNRTFWTTVKVFGLPGCELRSSITIFEAESPVFSPDGEKLAFTFGAIGSRSFRIINLKTGRIAQGPTSRPWISKIQFLDNQTVQVESGAIYDANTALPIEEMACASKINDEFKTKVMAPEPGWYFSAWLATSDCSRYLVGGSSGSVRIFDELHQKVTCFDSDLEISEARFSPDGNFVLASTDFETKLIDSNTGETRMILQKSDKWAVSSDGTYVTGLIDHTPVRVSLGAVADGWRK